MHRFSDSAGYTTPFMIRLRLRCVPNLQVQEPHLFFVLQSTGFSSSKCALNAYYVLVAMLSSIDAVAKNTEMRT